ncbi:MAG: sigma-70 family RNA polymerase sigma factor [Myxococcota bacterium]
MSLNPQVEAARRGRREAFEGLVRAHAVAVHAVALRIVKDPVAADDVVQETFLAAWRGLPKLRDAERFSGWVLGIARRRAQDLARRSRDVPVADMQVAESSPPPEQRLMLEESAGTLWSAVELLSPGQRDAVLLYYREGRSVAEVAEQLEVPEPTVRKRLSRARADLRRDAELVAQRAAVTVGALVAASVTRRAWAVGLGLSAAVCMMLGVGVAQTVQGVAESLPPSTPPNGPTVVEGQVPQGTPPASTRGRAHIEAALLAAEDARFYEHGGVDGRAILRATFHNLTSDRGMQGGSTLTQQLAKQRLQGRTASRLEGKIAETLYAWKLETDLDKATILDRYLSEVWFGGTTRGIDAAAADFFHTTPEALSVGQAAMLAALPAGPAAYNPRTAPVAARARRAWVLAQMVDRGWLDPSEAARANAEPLTADSD